MISVIVPVYNTVKYLEECLQSIAAQNSALEIILINDGSDDGSELICRKWADEGRAVLLEGKREGLSAARNIGIKVAKGEFITFVDSDDKLMPGALDFMLSIAQNHPDCGIVEAQLSSDENRRCYDRKADVFTAKRAIEITLYQSSGHNSSACGKLYRTNLFEKSYLQSADGMKTLKYSRIFRSAHNIAVSPYTVYYYRPNPDSFINTYTPQRKDMLWATEKLMKYVVEYYPDLAQATRSRRSALYAICLIWPSLQKSLLWQASVLTR